MEYSIESHVLFEQPTAVIRARLAADQVPTWMPTAFEEVFAELARQGVEPAGPPFARYVFHPGVLEVEAGVPVAEPLVAWGRVAPGTLPAGPVAVTTHVGPYEGLDKALDALTEWIDEHDGEPTGAHWENYFSDPVAEPDPEKWRTDVYLPWGRLSESN